MRAALLAAALSAMAAAAAAQSPAHFDEQVARGVEAMAQTRTKQLNVVEWMKERVVIDAVRHSVKKPASAQQPMVGVFTARVAVSQSRRVPEAQVRADGLPLDYVVRGYDVELRFVPDPSYGKWVFQGGRYWTLDADGRRFNELRMFPDLLTNAPSDVPHQLAWAIMAP